MKPEERERDDNSSLVGATVGNRGLTHIPGIEASPTDIEHILLAALSSGVGFDIHGERNKDDKSSLIGATVGKLGLAHTPGALRHRQLMSSM